MKYQLYKKQKGFTLPEIIVGLAIIAVVAILVAPKILDAFNAQAEEKITSDLTSLVSAAVVWKGARSNFSGLSCNAVVSGGYGQVAIDSCSASSPHDGSYTLSATGNTVTASVTAVPTRMCTRLNRSLGGTNSTGSCSGGTASVTYNYGD